MYNGLLYWKLICFIYFTYGFHNFYHIKLLERWPIFFYKPSSEIRSKYRNYFSNIHIARYNFNNEISLLALLSFSNLRPKIRRIRSESSWNVAYLNTIFQLYIFYYMFFVNLVINLDLAVNSECYYITLQNNYYSMQMRIWKRNLKKN